MLRARSSNLWGGITILLIICCLVTVGLCVNTAAPLPGWGTQADPWRIESLADFNEFAADANYWDDYTRLETDVNLAGLTYSTAVVAPDTNSSSDGFQGTAFTGVFEGSGYKITGLTIDDGGAGNDYLGLFGHIYRGGEVRNLSLEGGSVSGDNYIGGLVGFNDYGIVSNCYATATVTGNKYVGGLVGLNYYDGKVSNCYAAGTVSGVSWVGGLVGINHFGTVSICYAAGNVFGSGSVGGLVGYNNYGTVSKCYATGTVSGVAYVGGLVGYRYYGTVSNCYASGSVSGGYWYVGGLVGWNNSTVSNCYATGSVSGSSVGGLVGYDYFGTVTASFWDIDTSGQATSAGGTGKTTAQMQTQSTFTDYGWDFVEIWNIGENQTYPYLRQYPAGDLNHDGRVDLIDFAIFADHWLEGIGN